MPTIRIDSDVFERLQALAEPFIDTPNSVIRRLLDKSSGTFTPQASNPSMPKSVIGSPLAVPKGAAGKKFALTPQPIYETFLLYALATKFNGAGHKQDVTKVVLELMKSNGYINDADLETVSTGESKAANTVSWGRNALKDDGLISRNSQKGVWELTQEGLVKAKQIELPIAL